MKKIILIISTLALIAVANNIMAQGCMDAGSDEGVNVIGYIQPQAEYNFLGDNLSGESLDQSSFYFNRARLGVVGNIPYDFSYYALMEFSPEFGGAQILDAFITYNRFGPYAKLSFGQFKQPFGLELSTACHKLYTINRSDVVRNLAGPFRDFGFMLSGGTGDFSILGSKTENLFGYNLALINGTGINTPDDNKKKDIIARVTFHPVDMITIGANYKTGEHPAASLDATQDDKRTRIGFDVQLNVKGLILQGEYIDGSDEGSYTIGGGCGDPLQVIQGSVDRTGFFAQAIYRTKWDIEPVVKIEQYDPNIADDSINDKQNIITYGVNYYFNDWTRMQINYLYKAEESAAVEVPNDALLFQMQVVF